MHALRVFRPFALGLLLTCQHASAVPLEQAQINRIVSDVRVVDPRAGAHPASMHELIKEDLGVLTGIRSRSELLFQDLTLTRLGAETFFSFKPGTRDMTLDRGAFLLHVPKGHGGARIHAAGITAAITGTTIMIELMPGRWLKVIVLEGSLRLSNNRRLGDAVRLTAGKMVIMKPDATRIPDPVDIDLATLVRTSALMDPTVFKPLPSLALIDREIAAQARLKDKKQLVDTNLVIFGSGTQVVAASPTLLDAIDPKKESGTSNTPLFAALSKASQPTALGGISNRIDTTQTLARSTASGPINTALTTLGTTTRTATPTLATIASTARSSAAALGGGVTSTASQLTNEASNTLQGATGTLLTSGTQLSNGSLAIVGATSSNLLANATNLTGNTITGNLLGGTTNIVGGTVGNVIDTTGNLLGGTTNIVGGTVGNVIDTTGNLLGGATNVVGGTFGNVIDTTGNLLGGTTTIVGGTTNVIGGTAANVIDATGGTVLGGTTTNVGGSTGTIFPVVDSTTNLIGGTTTGTAGTTPATDTSTNLITGTSNLAGGTSDPTASSGSNVVDATTNLPGAATSVVSAPADSTITTATTTTTPVETVTAATLPLTSPIVSTPTAISPAPTPAPAPAPSFNVTDSGQLASLLSSTAPTTSGSIQYSSVGDNIVVNGQTLDAGRTGTVEIRHTGPGGIIALTNATLKGDVVKVGTLGPNGQLIIGGGVIDANSAIKLYAAGSNGEVRFVDNVSLKGASVKTIAGSTVTINNGKVVTVGGLRPADVFTDRANYSGSGGNGSTTGRFGGAGARTKPFSQAPSF